MPLLKSLTLVRLLPRSASAMGVFAAALLAGCVAAPVQDSYAYTSTTVYSSGDGVYMRYGYPPPPRVEYRSIAPSNLHIWVNGGWWWSGSRYDWYPGYWAPPGYRPPPPHHYHPPPPPHRPHARPPHPHGKPPAARPPQQQLRPRPHHAPQGGPAHRPAPRRDEGHRR